MLARCRLARKHHGARSVVYRVRNVGYLGTGRTGVVYHGLQHLGCRDDPLAAETAGGDYLFLNCGELLKRYLNAHVASCDHDAVGCLDDSFNILNAGAVFDFRDDVDVISSVFVEEASHDVNILAHRNKGACNEINIVFNAEKQILLILLAEVFLLEHLPREAHALSVAERSAHNDRGMDVISLRNIDTEFHKSVVQEYRIAGIKLMRQIFI